MKIFLIALGFSFISLHVSAQDTTITITTTDKWKRNNLNLRLGPELGFASGDFNETHQVGIGGSATLDLPVARRWSLIFYAAARSFGGDVMASGSDAKYRRANIFPARVGINYKFTPSFYGGVQLGESVVQYLGVTRTDVSQALAVGYFNGFLDVGARWDYEYAHGGLSSLNIQAKYVITLGVRK